MHILGGGAASFEMYRGRGARFGAKGGGGAGSQSCPAYHNQRGIIEEAGGNFAGAEKEFKAALEITRYAEAGKQSGQP